MGAEAGAFGDCLEDSWFEIVPVSLLADEGEKELQEVKVSQGIIIEGLLI